MDLNFFRFVLLAAAAAVFLPHTASAWQADLSPRPTLTFTEVSPTRAVLKIGLGSKWKTYAADTTSDTGIPPQFDWSGSLNLKGAKVLFPKPKKLSTLGVAFLGYQRNLTLPIDLTAADPSQPIKLRLKLQWVICDKICIPLEEDLELTLSQP